MVETHKARNSFWHIIGDLEAQGFRDEEYVYAKLSRATTLYNKVKEMYPEKAEKMEPALREAQIEAERAWLRGDFTRARLAVQSGDYFG